MKKIQNFVFLIFAPFRIYSTAPELFYFTSLYIWKVPTQNIECSTREKCWNEIQYISVIKFYECNIQRKYEIFARLFSQKFTGRVYKTFLWKSENILLLQFLFFQQSFIQIKLFQITWGEKQNKTSHYLGESGFRNCHLKPHRNFRFESDFRKLFLIFRNMFFFRSNDMKAVQKGHRLRSPIKKDPVGNADWMLSKRRWFGYCWH